MPLSTRKIALVATAALGLLALAACGGGGDSWQAELRRENAERQQRFEADPLQKAIVSNDTEAIARLVKAGRDADGEMDGYDYWTPIHYAGAIGKHGALSALLEADPDADADVTVSRVVWSGSDWFTPMYFAFHDASGFNEKEDDVTVIRILLAAGANPNAPMNSMKGFFTWNLPLAYAASPFGSVAAVAALLEGGADPNAKDGRDWTAIFYADSVAVAKALLEAGADPNMKSNSGNTPLSWAMEKGNVAVVAALVEAGADPNEKNAEGYTLLHMAAQKGDAAAIAALLEAGMDPNEREVIGGNTALHMVRSENRAAMIALIEGGADPNLRNNNGELPMASAELLQQAHEEEERAAEAKAERERLEAEAAQRRAEAEQRRAEAEAEADRRRAEAERRRILDENQENTWRMWCLANPSQCTTYQVIPW